MDWQSPRGADMLAQDRESSGCPAVPVVLARGRESVEHLTDPVVLDWIPALLHHGLQDIFRSSCKGPVGCIVSPSWSWM